MTTEKLEYSLSVLDNALSLSKIIHLCDFDMFKVIGNEFKNGKLILLEYRYTDSQEEKNKNLFLNFEKEFYNSNIDIKFYKSENSILIVVDFYELTRHDTLKLVKSYTFEIISWHDQYRKVVDKIIFYRTKDLLEKNEKERLKNLEIAAKEYIIHQIVSGD